jgi:serine/threonine protein kinase
VLAIEYFANYHLKHFFHGDIKLDNIFVSNIFELTSDAGTLLFLGDNDDLDSKKYIINLYTPGYASPEHISDIDKKIPRSRN